MTHKCVAVLRGAMLVVRDIKSDLPHTTGIWRVIGEIKPVLYRRAVNTKIILECLIGFVL